jgi:hypothetical protein
VGFTVFFSPSIRIAFGSDAVIRNSPELPNVRIGSFDVET